LNGYSNFINAVKRQRNLGLVASIQEELKNMTSVPSNKHLFKKPTSPFKGKPIVEMWLSMLLFRVQTNEKGIDKVYQYG
jgi:hypothetical protein